MRWSVPPNLSMSDIQCSLLLRYCEGKASKRHSVHDAGTEMEAARR